MRISGYDPGQIESDLYSGDQREAGCYLNNYDSIQSLPARGSFPAS
jgi:hypothetical protein